ncbi:hypothetical protein A0H81_11089 [Grifola frondosa]|uniref:Uncharacterized protein n=1 Tax=Grifola frondosa TaxID=5627 RepID=A0A1C7LX68_GRIFR|nr:hypothetical protein A0H81_11089 [Grifola frondosa]
MTTTSSFMASIAKPPKGLAEIIQNVIKDHHTDVAADAEPEHPQSPPILKIPLSSDRHSDFPAPSVARVASSGYRIPPVGTPAERTGPPRSISFNYSLSSAPAASPSSHPREGGTLSPTADEDETPDRQFDFPPASSPFRGALEYDNPEQREREREIAERKHKRRDSYFHEGGWNPRKWLVESPKEEETQFNFGTTLTEAGHGDEEENRDESRLSPQPIRTPLRQSRSMPHIQGQENERISSSPRWGRLRSLIPHIAQNRPSAPPHPAVTPLSVNITDELITGGLATLMIRLWIERDEKGHRRVPVLFHRLKIRISDSLHPMHGNKAVFRIECEYANGAVRWVVYRQLREFLSLHGHYAISNAYNRNVETLPEFPFNSLPYFKFLKEKGNELGKADFARLQRQMLENYLVGLIRAVMFHPASNRLAGFLELGALTIALAQSGAQYKAGFLRIDAVSPKGGLGRKAAGRSEKRRQRWCAIRESYLVVLEEMGELTVWDVFLIDQDFRIERPMRYYRQGLNLFHQLDVEHEDDTTFNGHKPKPEAEAPRRRLNSTVGSLKSSISKVFHLGNNGQSREQTQSANGQRTASTSHGRPLSTSSRSSASPSSIALSSRPLTPMLDPSTHTNALQGGEDHNEHVDRQAESGDQKKREKDVSKHTFYIENSQVRLKLFARNEVRICCLLFEMVAE